MPARVKGSIRDVAERCRYSAGVNAARSPDPLLVCHPDVSAALARGQPVVALESTIVSHGMPWPRNLQTAQALEDEVRAQGAVPATCAVIDGRLCAGLAPGQLERLARDGPALAKASRRDLPLLLARKDSGATTVAATMIIAARAGIRVFTTGGIGGVHRGAETSFDVSADLTELARTPVAVVCAGPKAILDLKLTLEVLETHGVPVIGYRTATLPAFWTRDTGLPVDARVDEPAGVARAMHAQWELGGGGLLVAQPVAPEHALPPDRVEQAIARALDDARTQGIGGKALTPFLLARIGALTGGDSLEGNIALVRANARLAAEIAVAWSALQAGAGAC